ncbi:MAG: hypothetical protein KAX99_06760, partial [Azonexus sp.]|nr:hypothetical protein [Azonexus sp.]
AFRQLSTASISTHPSGDSLNQRQTHSLPAFPESCTSPTEIFRIKGYNQYLAELFGRPRR